MLSMYDATLADALAPAADALRDGLRGAIPAATKAAAHAHHLLGRHAVGAEATLSDPLRGLSRAAGLRDDLRDALLAFDKAAEAAKTIRAALDALSVLDSLDGTLDGARATFPDA
jgi:hypothetical protein